MVVVVLDGLECLVALAVGVLVVGVLVEAVVVCCASKVLALL